MSLGRLAWLVCLAFLLATIPAAAATPSPYISHDAPRTSDRRVLPGPHAHLRIASVDYDSDGDIDLLDSFSKGQRGKPAIARADGLALIVENVIDLLSAASVLRIQVLFATPSSPRAPPRF